MRQMLQKVEIVDPGETTLLAGEQIVLVATASAHRQAAFDAAQFIMDFLKTDAPFWKAEERDGKTSWVEARDSDTAARDKWHDDSASPSRSGSGD